MPERKVLRIDTIRDAFVGELEIDGEIHQVKQITLGMQQALDAITAETSGAVLREVVAGLVPTLTEKQIAGQTLESSKAITIMAASNIEAVEKLFPNAVSPASTTSPG